MTKRDDIFLSKWLNNQLTEEELNNFKSSEDYELYLKIIEETDKLQAPSYDLNSSFQRLKEHCEITESPQKKWRYINIAASIILLIGLFAYFNFYSEITYSSGYGEHVSFNLPDGSKVILNSKSTISYNKHNWDKHRALKLHGEAFFDVEKGNAFTVSTKLGDVSVLGTEFNVNATNDYFNVACFEGKVKVKDYSNSSTHILTPTLGYQHIKNEKSLNLSFKNENPTWLHQQSDFKSTPIKYVFKTLEKQYNIRFSYTNFDDSILFTGVFPNNNQHIALETVLKSVNLKYTIQGNRVILED
jgi:ferric-dicitrate binding protein FerR (iron transport regulator)